MSEASRPKDISRQDRQRLAVLVRNVLNDLKRDVSTAAIELDVDPAILLRFFSGEESPTLELLDRISRTYRVNLRELMLVHDDTDRGVYIMSKSDSEATKRTFARGGVPYYDYYDTAMSRLVSFRPELLCMLVEVDDADCDNSKVRWNNGHFLFQLTYIIGKVNYYHESNGKKHCFQLNDGDSAVGYPFCRHSFTKRSSDFGAILALTFGGRISGDAQQELSALGPDKSVSFVLSWQTEEHARSSLIIYHATNMGLTANSLSSLSGLSLKRTVEIWEQRNATMAEAEIIARALRISLRDLIGTEPDTGNGIRVELKNDSFVWRENSDLPFYEYRRLANSNALGTTAGLELTPLRPLSSLALEGEMMHGLHEYGYVIGKSPVEFEWITSTGPVRKTLNHGDSFYVSPFVRHRFGTLDNSLEAKIVILRIPGKIGGDQLVEASSFGEQTIKRLITDDKQWFNP